MQKNIFLSFFFFLGSQQIYTQAFDETKDVLMLFIFRNLCYFWLINYYLFFIYSKFISFSFFLGKSTLFREIALSVRYIKIEGKGDCDELQHIFLQAEGLRTLDVSNTDFTISDLSKITTPRTFFPTGFEEPSTFFGRPQKTEIVVNTPKNLKKIIAHNTDLTKQDFFTLLLMGNRKTHFLLYFILPYFIYFYFTLFCEYSWTNVNWITYPANKWKYWKS